LAGVAAAGASAQEGGPGREGGVPQGSRGAQAVQAARYFGAAEALRRAVGAALSPADRIDHERATAQARAVLGGEAFDVARAAGAAAPLDEVVEEALERGLVPLRK
jgi:hypothetical protein